MGSEEFDRAWDRQESELAQGVMGRFVAPQYRGRCLSNVSTSLARAVATNSPESWDERMIPLDPTTDPLAGRRAEGTVILLLVDGLGWRAFRRAVEAPRAGRLLPWAERARPITSVFPSTTTCALTSLSTGLAPAQHGIVGHRMYLPRWGVMADMLRMSPSALPGRDLLFTPEFNVTELSGVPTLFQRGLSAAVVSREAFAGSGFTRLLYAGAEYVPYATASGLSHVLGDLLNRPNPPPAVFVYWDELDTSHHIHGPEASLFELELERIQGLLRAVVRRINPERAKGTQLWITGDHGQVSLRPEANVALEQHPDILHDLTGPAGGDRRAAFLTTRPGRAPNVAMHLRELLPGESVVKTMEAARSEGLFGPGPPHPELSERTGDLLALPASPGGISYESPGRVVRHRLLAGAHGGLEREELWIPLVAGRLSDLAGAE
ncbi:MAG: alkaline phosphatase family protein [Thermoplasmata archaeon]|nr:alkaline phosphatase family protein [Thermoplasmata archaeon]